MNSSRYVIKQDICRCCETCRQVCPSEAIIINNDKVVSIDYSCCTRCGECLASCKLRAIVKQRGIYFD